MSSNFQAFLNSAAAHYNIKPAPWAGQEVRSQVPGCPVTTSAAIVPLKLKVWRKLDSEVTAFSQMAKEDWPVHCPAPSEQLEVLGLVLRKKLATYPEMQEIHDPVELTKLADAVTKAGKTLENVMLLIGQLKEEYEAAKAAEEEFVKTLS